MFDPDTHVPKRSREEWRKRAKRCDIALLTPLQLAIDNLYCQNLQIWKIAVELETTVGVVKAQLTRIDKKRRNAATRIKWRTKKPKKPQQSIPKHITAIGHGFRDFQMQRTLDNIFRKPLHYKREAEQLKKVRRAILDG